MVRARWDRAVDGKRLGCLEVALSSLGTYYYEVVRLGRHTLGGCCFRALSRCHLHGGIVIFLIIYMGDHYRLRGDTLVFLIIYMGELSRTVLERSWVGLGRPWEENSANRHVNGSKHLHGGMLLGRSLRLLKGFINGFNKFVHQLF